VHERLLNLRRLDLEPYDEGPEGHRFCVRRVAREVGATLTGLSVYELEPGQATWPYHFELAEEEWLIVVDGELMLRTEDGERTLRAGDVACFPPGAGGGHAVRNASGSTARFAMPSSVARHADGCVYPESGKFVLRGPGFSHRGRLGEPVEYWDGEA
jgi:uncharacterized cupin superfamily protein